MSNRYYMRVMCDESAMELSAPGEHANEYVRVEDYLRLEMALREVLMSKDFDQAYDRAEGALKPVSKDGKGFENGECNCDFDWVTGYHERDCPYINPKVRA